VFLAEHAPTIAEAAAGRIRACESEYGDSYVWTPLRHLLDELGEGAALLAAITRHADVADALIDELRRALIPEARA